LRSGRAGFQNVGAVLSALPHRIKWAVMAGTSSRHALPHHHASAVALMAAARVSFMRQHLADYAVKRFTRTQQRDGCQSV
jgi:uncharacterized membrane protein